MLSKFLTIRKQPHQGTIYVAVSGVTMVVAIMAAAGMSLSRLELRVSESAHNQQEARLLARSAVEAAVSWIDYQNHVGIDWRTAVNHNEESPRVRLGNGTFAWKLVDVNDTSLSNSPAHALYAVGIGRAGKATAVEKVLLQPTERGVTSLKSALHSGNDINFTPGESLTTHILTTNQQVSANREIDATGTHVGVSGDAWAVDSITGSVSGSQLKFQSPDREMPGNDVFTYYVNNGTPIDIESLPKLLGTPAIHNVLISPHANPFGPTNPQGIYVIDCKGETVSIGQCRIVGTLVLLNNANTSNTRWIVVWEPAVPNYPCLLVQNDFNFNQFPYSMGELYQGQNFNPPGTPYKGVSDNDQNDIYDSEINGLVYVGGTLTYGESDARTNGVIIAQDVLISAKGTAKYDDTYLKNPPPGFGAGSEVRISPGSWQRAALTP